MFFIVRHGNTFETGEAPRRIGARTDLPLTVAGIAQAEALGRHFAADFAASGIRLARVLSSPLIRTRETAATILRHLSDPPEARHESWLREIDHGPDENRSEAEVLARIGGEALAAWDERGVAPPGWDVDAEARVAAWKQLFQTDAGPTLLVTSNGAARFALIAAGLGNGAAGMKLRTGSYGLIERDRSGALTVSAWDRRP